MVAAVLHLHIGPGAPLNALDQVPCGLLHRHDVVDRDLLMWADAELRRTREDASRFDPRIAAHFLVVPDHAIDFRHRHETIRADLRRAPGDDDARLRALALEAADGLARLAFCFAGNRAGIDDDDIAGAFRPKTGGSGSAADHLGLVGVEPAAEGDDVDAHAVPPAASNSAGSNRPSNSYSTGPVIKT